MLTRLFAVSLPFVLLTAVAAQDKAPPAAAAQDAAAKKNPMLEKVLTADDKRRPKALAAFLEDQLATGAVYAGQYAGLAKIKDAVVPLLTEWVLDAPAAATNDVGFRSATINALRDLLGNEAPKALMETLSDLAQDDFEEPRLQTSAKYALAQFGDRSMVNEIIKKAKARTEGDKDNDKANGWNTLANVYYNLREYKEAAAAYKALLAIPGLRLRASFYYNAGCTMALAGQTDEALDTVEKALKISKATNDPLSKRMLETDMDIASLRKSPRFPKMLEAYFSKEPVKDPAKKDPAKKAGDKGK